MTTAHFSRRFKVFSGFIVVQLVVQGLNFLCGLLLVRTLIKQEYAYYTVAMSMQGAFAILSECGVTIAVNSIGGQIWQDRYRFGQLINTAQGFRTRLAGAAALLVGPLLLILLRQNRCPWFYALVLTSSVLVAGYLQLTVGTLLRVPLLHSQVAKVQKLDLQWAFSRVVLVGIGLAVQRLNAAYATIATLVSYGLQRIFVERLAYEKVDRKAPVHPDDNRAITTIFKSQIATALYYCTQGQITVWILSWWGSTGSVADLGALSRFSLAATLVGSVMQTLVQPAFARCQSRRQLGAIYVEVVVGLFLFGLVLILAALLFPSIFLALLGKQYMHLQVELVLAMISLAIGTVATGTTLLNYARGWVQFSWLYAPITIFSQAFLLCVFNVNHLSEAIIFGALTPLPSIVLNFFIAAEGFRKMPRIESPEAKTLTSTSTTFPSQ